MRKKAPVKKKKVKKRPNFGQIYIKLFKTNIYYVCCSRRDYDILINHVFNAVIPEDKEGFGGTTEGYEKDNQIIDVIWINKKCGKDSTVIAHESFHVVFNILQRKGIWLTQSSEELYAYLMQSIMIDILNDWKKK